MNDVGRGARNHDGFTFSSAHMVGSFEYGIYLTWFDEDKIWKLGGGGMVRVGLVALLCRRNWAMATQDGT